MKLHPNIRLLTWFNFFSDFKLYAPIAIIYFSQVSGSFALGMSVFSVAMISSALFEIPTGIFSDRIGRKKTVTLGALSSILYAIFYAIGINFWILAIGAVFDGLSQAFYTGNNDALLHDTLTETKEEHQYDEFLGKVSAMFQIALAISAILGSILATWSFALIMWLSVIPQIICLVLSLKLIEPHIEKHESSNVYSHLREAIDNFLNNKKLRQLSLASIVSYGIGEAMYVFQSAFYNTLWPIWAIGIAKVLSNIGASISFHFSGRIIKRYNILKVLIAGNFYSRVVGVLGTAFPSALSPLILSSSSLFFGVSQVAKSSLFQKEFRSDQRATMGSLNSFAGSLFFGLIAISLGFIADVLSPAQALFIFQLIMFLPLWIYWRMYKKD